ncbi:hypothetical protein PAMA_011867 [Pampus argenteus]
MHTNAVLALYTVEGCDREVNAVRANVSVFMLLLSLNGGQIYANLKLELVANWAADERDRVQKKTFTKWVNKHLIKQQKSGPSFKRAYASRAPPLILLRGEDEEEEEEGVQGPREKGRMRFHRLQNVQIALDFLKQRQVKLVNIRNDDITDGNPKLTLGLIWTIILHFQITREMYHFYFIPTGLFGLMIMMMMMKRLLHRRTAPPDEGEAWLSNGQNDSRTQEVYDWTTLEHSSQPTLVLRESNTEVGGDLQTGIQGTGM